MQLRAGIVGLGKQALEDHIPGIHASDSAGLVAVCDEDPEIVREQQYRHRVQGYTDFREMFQAEALDLVVVCVPHHVGRQVIEAAAEHKVHVLKEKPFATTIKEAKKLADICARADVQLMVTLQRRFNPIYTSFRQLADQVGSPFVVDAQYTLHVDDPSEGWRGRTAEAKVMYEQLMHLADSVSDRISVHVVPNGIAHRGTTGAFTLATMADRSEVSYAETNARGIISSSREDVTALHESFEMIRNTALPVGQSVDLIRRTAEERWST